MTLPLVSIVTPAFNQGEYLEETIKSVLAQDYPLIEYIVINDGSTDSTQEVMDRFKNRLRCISHQNMGQAMTLNKGWAMSSGSLLGYLSSDDCLRPSAISTLVNAIRGSDASLVYCDYELIDSGGIVIKKVVTEDFNYSRMKVDLICHPGPGALFRRELFEKHGGWSQNLHQIPDFDYWLRISAEGAFLRVPEMLAQYRVHNKSASFNKISIQRSREIVDVVSEFWAGEVSRSSRKSVSTAHLIAAKNNLQSGRFAVGIAHWTKAVGIYPCCSLSIFSWRVLLVGSLRRLYYALFNMGGRV